MTLVFYYKDMLEKVTMERTQQFSDFSLLPKEPIEWGISFFGNALISLEPLIRIMEFGGKIL